MASYFDTHLRIDGNRQALAAASAAVITTVVSIAASQILLGIALLVVLITVRPLRFPTIAWPLGAFLVGTLLSLALSTDAAAGRPQIRKLYLFTMLLVVTTALRHARDVRRVILWLATTASLSACWSFVQFYLKTQQAAREHVPFYLFYVGRRVTGFMSHWMTFGGEMSIVLLLLLALLLFDRPSRAQKWCWLALALIGTGLILSFVRGMWFAALAGVIYLIACWRPKWLLAIPILAVIGFFIAPVSVQQRLLSVYQPHGDVDSNRHRIVTWRTGVEMIKAHPWFGVGPEEVGLQFKHYLPADITGPLPEGWYGHLHNVYLQYAAERGIPVLIAFLWLMTKILYDARNALRRASTHRRAILHGCIAAVIAVLVGGIFEMNLGDSEVLMLFLAVVSFIYVREPQTA